MIESVTGKLRRHRHADPVAPDGLLAALAGLGLAEGLAFGFVMAPARFDVVRIAAGAAEAFEGDAAALLRAAYEIRLFGPATDAHWQRTGADAGRLTVLTVQDGVGEPVDGVEAGTIRRGYRMWGEAEPVPERDGWARLSESRIRAIPVPVAAAKGARLRLCAEEHVGRLEHGNAVVLAERLTDIAVVSGDEGREGGEPA